MTSYVFLKDYSRLTFLLVAFSLSIRPPILLNCRSTSFQQLILPRCSFGSPELLKNNSTFSFRLKGLMYKARYNKLADLWDNGDENNGSTGMNWVDVDTLGERQER